MSDDAKADAALARERRRVEQKRNALLAWHMQTEALHPANPKPREKRTPKVKGERKPVDAK